MGGVLGDPGVLGDTETGDSIGDDSGMRDGGDGVACGHGSSGPNMDGLRMRLRRMGFDFVVSFGSAFSSAFCFIMTLGTGMGAADVDSETDVAAVSTLAVENSLSLSDELEEALAKIALRPDSRFFAKSLCTELVVVICDAANWERDCRACGSEDAMSDHEGSLVRGFFAR